MKRIIYHVSPSKSGWGVKKEGSGTAKNFADKSKAVKFGRKLASSHALGQLKVHRQDGRLQTEYTYGQDPKRYPS